MLKGAVSSKWNQKITCLNVFRRVTMYGGRQEGTLRHRWRMLQTSSLCFRHSSGKVNITIPERFIYRCFHDDKHRLALKLLSSNIINLYWHLQTPVNVFQGGIAIYFLYYYLHETQASVEAIIGYRIAVFFAIAFTSWKRKHLFLDLRKPVF